MKKDITIQKLISAATKQPYLIWHNLEDVSKNLEEENIKFQLPSFSNLLEVDNYTQIQAKAFGSIDSEFNKKFLNIGGCKIIDEKSREDKVIQTESFLNDDSIIYIINATFKYEVEDYVIYFTTKLFDKRKRKFSLLKISTSTKFKDILQFWFINEMLHKLNIQIDDCSLYIIATKEYERGGVDFYETSYINTSKSSRSDKEAKKDLDFFNMQLAKSGQGLNKQGNKYESHKIFDILKQRAIIKPKKEIYLPTIESCLRKISLGSSIKSLEIISDNDLNDFSDNNIAKQVRDLTTKYSGWNGNVLPIKNIIDNNFENLPMYSKYKNGNISVDKERVIKYKKLEEKNIVWYDFEAFSIPRAPSKGMLPFQQAVSQVSIIKTNNFEEKAVENIVIDPLEYGLEKMKLIINSVYDKDANHYVVFNAGYENTRLKEMATLIYKYDHDASYIKKVEEIENKTIDLELPFKTHKNKMPWILLPDTKGRSSIKIIEKFISNHYPHLVLESKVKEYSSLKVKHGMMAMEIANERALNIMGDKEWQNKVESLKKYCENDVRAMIMVYLLIKELSFS